jgi:DNA-binding HxlR family transcriptional regulator
MSEPPVRLTGSLADRDAWRADDCSIAAALEVLGAQSSFLLLREAMYGATRFEEFVRRTGLSEPVVAARLRALVDAGLLDREPYRDPGQRSRQAYALTERGTALLPAFVALLRWGDRWVAPHGGPVELRHRGCDHTVDVHLVCSAGHTVEPDELDLRARRRPAR